MEFADVVPLTTALRRAARRAGPAVKCATCDALTPLQAATGPFGRRSLLCFCCGLELLSSRSRDDRYQLSDD